LSERDLLALSREAFQVKIDDALEEFYCAEALEYVASRRQERADAPIGICGPIGPTEQLPPVATIFNAIDLKLHDAHFWGLDEWVEDSKTGLPDYPLSVAKPDMELCFNRLRPELRMPSDHIHFPIELESYSTSCDDVRCVLMQGGQGEVKHWAFNDPPKCEGRHRYESPTPAGYGQLRIRITDLHPMAVIQKNARTIGSG
jgi:glucosamine-6-phosphate deaminase